MRLHSCSSQFNFIVIAPYFAILKNVVLFPMVILVNQVWRYTGNNCNVKSDWPDQTYCPIKLLYTIGCWMFVKIIDGLGQKVSHYVKSYYHARSHNYDPVFLNISQICSCCLDNIYGLVHMASVMRKRTFGYRQKV